MIKLEDLHENSGLYDPADLDSNDLDSDEFPGLLRANSVGRVRFGRIPDESRAGGRSAEATISADPLHIYFRSINKIPLLTREEEVILAKKIESAKLEILRLLSLTTISSFTIREMSNELQPRTTGTVNSAAAPLFFCGQNRESDGGSPLEERRRVHKMEIRKILMRIEKLESKYRLAEGDPARMRKSRESIFLTLQRIDFSEDQICKLIESVKGVLCRMDDAQKAANSLSPEQAANHRVVYEAHSSLRDLETQYLTNAAELREIVVLIHEKKRELTLAKDQFVRANLRLVLSIVKNYSYPGFDPLDLVQEGNMGLMKAVDKFNYRLGYKLSTYATWWIRQSITRAIADKGRTIRIPVHMVEAMNRVRKASKDLTKRLGREPSERELAEGSRIPVSMVTQILKTAQEPISLEASIADNKEAVLEKLIEDKSAISPESEVLKHNLREAADSALEILSPRERDIVCMRYGLNEAGREYTLQEVGEKFRVTRERIRQIEQGALVKLRFHSSKLRDFADFVSSN